MFDIYYNLHINDILELLKTLVVIIGPIIALVNFRVISNSHKLGAIIKFNEDLIQYEDDRRFLYQEFSINSTLEEKDEKKIRNVINSLNRISMMIDNKLISSNIVFALCHTMIIRCNFKLQDYIKYQQSLLGGRYGKRIIKMAQNAKRYHDCIPEHRRTIIYLYDNKNRVYVYKTKLSKNKGLRIFYYFKWWIVRMFNIY